MWNTTRNSNLTNTFSVYLNQLPTLPTSGTIIGHADDTAVINNDVNWADLKVIKSHAKIQFEYDCLSVKVNNTEHYSIMRRSIRKSSTKITIFVLPL